MAETIPTRVGDQRPGGRASRVRTAVLAATRSLLDEEGYDAVTYDAVGERAGVHRTTVYRRWPTRAELVGDALDLYAADDVPLPDTGRLRDDLIALARSVAANIGSEGGARRSRSIVAAAHTSSELTEGVYDFMARRVALAETIVDRAVERGEVSADCDPRLIVEGVVGPIWFRLLLTGEPIDEAFADALATLVSDSIGAA